MSWTVADQVDQLSLLPTLGATTTLPIRLPSARVDPLRGSRAREVASFACRARRADTRFSPCSTPTRHAVTTVALVWRCARSAQAPFASGMVVDASRAIAGVVLGELIGAARTTRSPAPFRGAGHTNAERRGKKGERMGVAMSIVMIAVGAILRFAVSVTTTGFNLHSIGLILMILVPSASAPITFWSAWWDSPGSGPGPATGASVASHKTARADSSRKCATVRREQRRGCAGGDRPASCQDATDESDSR